MKTYTDIDQSRELAAILPVKTADMYYNNASYRGPNYVDSFTACIGDFEKTKSIMKPFFCHPLFELIPCWTLEPLLQALPPELPEPMNGYVLRIAKDSTEFFITYENSEKYTALSSVADNAIDACYEMIMKLHEQQILKV